MSKDQKWSLLQGITQGEQKGTIAGVLSIYSVDAKRHQPTMNAYGGCLMSFQLHGTNMSTLLTFTQKVGQSMMFNLLEIGVPESMRPQTLD